MIDKKTRELRKANDMSQIELVENEKVSLDELLKEKTKLLYKNTLPKNKKTKLAISLFALVAVVITIGIAIFLLVRPFSKDTHSIANAEKSVVKVFCYDYDGNESATGSGFIVYNDTTVVTNYHVMEEAYTCKISTDQDITYDVQSVICYSKENDIAILKLSDDTNLKPLTVGNSVKMEKGEVVTAIGSPLGIKNTVSQGILSGRIMKDSMDALQFTAAISSGSSGGALFNEKGQVVGITFAAYEEAQSLNLAIPIECVEKLYNEDRNERKVSTIYLEAHPYI